MKEITWGMGMLITLFLGVAYIFVWDDEPNYDNEACLKFAYEILGNPKHGKSCPRSLYASEVSKLNKSDKSGGAAIFIFRPIEGKEVQCPPVKILVDRMSGEASFMPPD